ncbi:MAG: alcohol dehydrogenase catalytic domain-containing protein, partial [Planctomycetes bacterium]|nr:alcohol dehydrogenase catalytic domain-containing protein [Planctomycetota bacterium]
MPPHTTAAVFDGPGQPLKLIDVPLPPLEEGEVLVEVTLCTICGSDLHSYSGRRSCACPTILGHEITGTVHEVAGSVHDLSGCELQPGDRVTWSIAASCGECFFCSRSIPQKCEQLAKYGHQPLTTHGAVGGLARHCRILPGTGIVRVPDSLSDAEVCPANCCTATAAAALRTAGTIEGASIAILGAGSLGITAAAMATRSGASDVFLADVDPSRLERAHAIASCLPVLVADGNERLLQSIADRTAGRGVGVVLEMTGSTDAAEQSLDLLRIGRRLTLWGG